MAKGKKKGKRLKFYFNIFLTMLIASAMIASGFYLLYLNKPSTVFCRALDNFIYKLENTSETKQITGFGESYALDSVIKFNLESNKLQNPITEEELQKKNLINNLNLTSTNIKVIQDKSKQKKFSSINSMFNETEELINSKKLIEDSTEYYYVNGIVPNYVNNGNNTYFETLTDTATTKTNLIYILKQISLSLNKNLKDDNFLVLQERIEINSKKKTLTKTTIELNNQLINEVAEKVLKDLQTDEMSSRILTGYDSEFKKIKYDENTKIFKEKQKLTVIMYSNCLGQVEKYIFILKDDGKDYRFSYEVKKQEAYIVENDKVLYRIDCKYTNTKKTFVIYNDADEEKGKIVYDDVKKRKTISMNLNHDNKIINFLYDSKLENIEKASSYDNNISISLKVVEDSNNLLNANVDIQNKITKDLTITEDTSSAMFASDVTEEQKNLLNQKKDNVITRLKS